MHLYVATNDDTLEKWNEFRNAFKENRFLINQQFTIIEEHLQTIISEEKREIDVGSTFFRARINRQAGKPYTAEELNMAPADKVGHGRLNPEGIPYLYLASDWKTAISEVRANDSDVVDIAKCECIKPLAVVDLTKEDNAVRLHNFRKIISEEFSKPVNSELSYLEYLPTQYIAEYIKNQGVQGVLYKSAVNPSNYNICLFAKEAIKVEYFKQISVAADTLDI